MPRLKNALPKYRKHAASGQAIVTINGRDYYLGPHGSKVSKLEYDRRIVEWLSSGRSLSFGASEHDLTIVELAVDYIQFAKSYYGHGPNSELHRIRRVVRPLCELYGRTPAIEFGILEFKAVRQRFLDEDCRRQFINASMRRTTRLFRWAAAEGLISPNVPQALAIEVAWSFTARRVVDVLGYLFAVHEISVDQVYRPPELHAMFGTSQIGREKKPVR